MFVVLKLVSQNRIKTLVKDLKLFHLDGQGHIEDLDSLVPRGVTSGSGYQSKCPNIEMSPCQNVPESKRPKDKMPQVKMLQVKTLEVKMSQSQNVPSQNISMLVKK